MKALLLRVSCYLAALTKVCKALSASFLVALLLGCSQRPQVRDDAGAKSASNDTNSSLDRASVFTNATMANDDLMSIWGSPDSTPEEVAKALTEGLPKDMTIESAQALLGAGGTLSHHFGVFFDAAGKDVQKGRTGYWILEYETPGGGVALRFFSEPGGKSRFDGAYAR